MRWKHRRFERVVIIFVLFLLTSALGLGLYAGYRWEKRKRHEALTGQIGQLEQKAKEFRRRLAEIRSRETPTMNDYFDQCRQLEGLLNEFEPHRKASLALMNSLYSEVKDIPKATEIMALLVPILEKDSQIIYVLRQEIERSRELERLPYSKQEAFWDREIVPIRTETERLAAEELTLLEEAQRRGFKLPSDVGEILGKE